MRGTWSGDKRRIGFIPFVSSSKLCVGLIKGFNRSITADVMDVRILFPEIDLFSAPKITIDPKSSMLPPKSQISKSKRRRLRKKMKRKVSVATCKEMDAVPPSHSCSLPDCNEEDGVSGTNLDNMVAALAVPEFLLSVAPSPPISAGFYGTGDGMVSVDRSTTLLLDEVRAEDVTCTEKKRRLLATFNFDLCKGRQ